MLSDVLLAFRRLRRDWAFASTAVLTLALGLGLNSTAFSVLNRLLLQPLPFRDPGRMVEILTRAPDGALGPLSPGDFCDLREQNTVFESIATFVPDPGSLAEHGRPPEPVRNLHVSADALRTLGVTPLFGRPFTTAEEHSQARLVLLSHQFWNRHFGSDPSVIGREVELNSNAATIIGVLPPQLDEPTALWGRQDLWALDTPAINRTKRDSWWYYPKARLKPGVTLEQARRELDLIAARLARDFPQTDGRMSFVVFPQGHDGVDETSRMLAWVTLGITLAILAITCANVANLQLVRLSRQEAEFALRLALGAPRGRLLRLQLAESLLVSLAAGVLGLAFSVWGNAAAEHYLAADVGLSFAIDWRVAGTCFALSAVTGAAFGLIPGLLAAKREVGLGLREKARGFTASPSGAKFRRRLVAGQIACTLVVLSAAAFFILGVRNLAQRKLGWNPAHLLNAEVVLPYARFQPQAGEQLVTRLQALPGVERAVVSHGSPIVGYPGSGTPSGFILRGRPPLRPEDVPQAHVNMVTPGYFETFGIPLLAGREFSGSDRAGSELVAVVNQEFAARYYPGRSALGQFVAIGDLDHPAWAEIVGIAANTRSAPDLLAPVTATEIYVPWYQHPFNWITITLRAAGQPPAIERALREAVATVDPHVAVFWTLTADSALAGSVRMYALAGKALSILAALGLLLSALGIYGVVANQVIERRREIAVRLSLGATPSLVQRLVLLQAVRMGCWGIVGGAVLTVATISLLRHFVPAVPAVSAAAPSVLAALLMALTVAAAWLPVRRASRTNPIEALRAD